ncbi:Na+/H+ antiporter NhaC family protein [Occultella gossypii]|uniref:Na+/H+ antiporter NhaC family protein n=1 Tax=Occultella gossypii TaxID=2800820 RepID=A0ABS7SAK0_9MICO|nr:Na+/H+ antiporter NhaC family protein [Occultella gossypii]MBZ2196903.1 Na+/H+ antiporter NhaC family protein [Occultella gossypii]
MNDEPELKFRGGWTMAFVPVGIFLIFCVLYFVVLDAFDMTALATGGFIALLIGALLARGYSKYWDAVMAGIGSPTSVSIVMVLFMVGMLGQLIKDSNVSGGFVWIADQAGLSGAALTLFTFLACCLIAMATGSSIGTMFTAFPIFYPAGVLLGADPTLLAGAIVSGAIFGDNLAPISDTTIISASTQRFRRKDGAADIGGVVTSRARYALVAAGVSAVAYLVFGGTGAGPVDSADLAEAADPRGLLMLIPIAVLLVVSFYTRNIFLAVTVGLILGTATALLSGLLDPSGVLGVVDGAPTGYLVTGVAALLPTVCLVISVFGIMGVLRAGGVLERIVDALARGRLAGTPRGAETAIGLGVSATTVLFGGVNSASMLAFGPIADEIGARQQLHPYRRTNVMDCFAMGVSCVVPVFSAFLFIGALLTGGHEQAPALSTVQLFGATLYPLVLTVVLIVAVATGWGRRFEGPDGVAVRRREDAAEPVVV